MWSRLRAPRPSKAAGGAGAGAGCAYRLARTDLRNSQRNGRNGRDRGDYERDDNDDPNNGYDDNSNAAYRRDYGGYNQHSGGGGGGGLFSSSFVDSFRTASPSTVQTPSTAADGVDLELGSTSGTDALLPEPTDSGGTAMYATASRTTSRYRFRDLLMGDFAFNDDGER